MKKIAKIAGLALIGCLMAWIVVSFIDITVDNNSPDASHASWNFFTVTCGRRCCEEVIEGNSSTVFDTSVLETWCGGSIGSIRMVGAWRYDANTYEDETGAYWQTDSAVAANSFYLLWIDDDGTPNDLSDDILVKVWEEQD